MAVLVIVIVIGLAGCAAPLPDPPPLAAAPPPPLLQCPAAPVAPVCAPASPDPADAAIRQVMTYQDRARQLPPSELAREVARLGNPTDPAGILELATVLGHSRGNGDIARALSVLEPLLRSTAPEAAPWQGPARWLSTRYGEQRRLEEQVERQAQQLRDGQRRIEQLTQQLEALKAIERSLNARPPASGPAPSPPASVPAQK
jgi:hypothetical protein